MSSALTLSMVAASVHTKIGLASVSCSACANTMMKEREYDDHNEGEGKMVISV